MIIKFTKMLNLIYKRYFFLLSYIYLKLTLYKYIGWNILKLKKKDTKYNYYQDVTEEDRIV